MFPLVVSHYTFNTNYEKIIENLKASLENLGLDYYIEGINTLGSWRENSNYCAQLVSDCLYKFPDRDILRVDADAIFRVLPSLFVDEHFDADIAACVYDFSYRQNELLGGTIFFRNSSDVREFVKEWAMVSCAVRKAERNGDLLQELLSRYEGSINFTALPPSYCKIFDRMEDAGDPVIEHFQASRVNRRLVNSMGRKNVE